MTKAEEILQNLPSVKIGLDDHYGKQTVLNALNQALSMSAVVGRSEQLGDTDYCNSCHKYVAKGYCNSFNCRWSKA
jgi:hypothetical protein